MPLLRAMIRLGASGSAAVVLCISLVRTAPAQEPDQSKWYDRLRFEGDFRPRFEYIGQDMDPEPEDLSRSRLRFRLRFGVTAPINNKLTVGFRLASNEGKNPISGNVTFGDAAVPKTIAIDKAYATWTPNSVLELTVGKFDNPLEGPSAVIASELVWDGDFTPEGLSETITLRRKSEGLVRRIAVAAQQWYLLEDSNESDTWMLGGRALADMKPGERTAITLAAGYYGFSRGRFLARAANSNDQLTVSNSVVLEDGTVVSGGQLIEPSSANPFDHFLNDFGVLDASASLRIDRVVGDAAMQLYGRVIQNAEADSLGSGLQFGAALDRMQKLPGWSVAASWTHLEQEAVLSMLSYSDLGRGGTNLQGLIAGVQYRPAPHVTFALREHIVSPIRTVQPNTQTNRLQIDVAFAF